MDPFGYRRNGPLDTGTVKTVATEMCVPEILSPLQTDLQTDEDSGSM